MSSIGPIFPAPSIGGAEYSLVLSPPYYQGLKMASSSTSTLAALCTVFLLVVTSAASSPTDAPTVWDVLEEYGLPRGLLPASVASYTLRDSDRFFTITLPSPCYVQFADLVYYDTKITGYLSFGSIEQLSSIQAKKLFLWVPISAVELDYANKQLEFKVGLLSQNYPLADFAAVKTCKKTGLPSASAGPCAAGSSSRRGVGSFAAPEVLALPVRQV